MVARRAQAKRYAQAVFEIAIEKKELERWQSDLEKVASLSKDDAFIALLENPKLHFDEKARLLSGWFGDMNPLTVNLIYLLVARGVLSMVGEIADEYQRLLDSYQGIERADVTTAVPLEDEDIHRLEERLEAVVHRKVVVTSEVDPSILGGIVARMGGKLLDGSTRSRLENLKNRLSGVSG